MADQIEPAIGELFARQYIARGAPLQDSLLFRNRLDAYLQANHYADYSEIASYLKQEGGLIVSTYYGPASKIVFYYNFPKFFVDTKIEHVLSAVTLVWRYLRGNKHVDLVTSAAPSGKNEWVRTFPKASAWQLFIARALREENMAYRLDANCGVHFFVDEEFERNRVTALSCLSSPRYAAVREAFERAHAHLDAQPSDTKAAVRSAFESLEILGRLMDTDSKNLNKWMVENKLKPLAIANASNTVEALVVGKLFDALAQFVDSIHSYRHGQSTEEPVVPSTQISVYVVSAVASALRLLSGIDASKQASS